MGQYHYTVNLDKKEFINPHGLGDGLKLWEQIYSGIGGVGAALVALLAVSNGRGGGDLPEDQRVVGRWGGDRIAIVGDYAEPTDLPAEFQADTIYEACHYENGYTDITPLLRRYFTGHFGISYAGEEGWYQRIVPKDI